MTVRDTYDEVAADYADQYAAELSGKPLDRALLDLLAASAGALGPIADLGCGPGQAAAHLASRAVSVLGIDLSPDMVEQARARHPNISFHTGDLRSLDVPDQAWGGIAALYSIIHLAPGEIPATFAEFHRVLKPGGEVLLSFHIGTEVRHLDSWWEHSVSLDFQFYTRDELEAALSEASLTPHAYVERRPYPTEVDTVRGYLLARREP